MCTPPQAPPRLPAQKTNNKRYPTREFHYNTPTFPTYLPVTNQRYINTTHDGCHGSIYHQQCNTIPPLEADSLPDPPKTMILYTSPLAVVPFIPVLSYLIHHCPYPLHQHMNPKGRRRSPDHQKPGFFVGNFGKVGGKSGAMECPDGGTHDGT